MYVQSERDAAFSLFSYFYNKEKKNGGHLLVYSATFLRYEKCEFKTSGGLIL